DASQFDAWWENAATGARGLAQISPIHAEEATLALHVSPEDQFHAVSAVEQQAWLLADRLRRFDGRPEVALSAIATTDRLVDGFAARNGADDVDAYMELMDYEGVRATVRGLLATRFAYAATYGSGSGDPTAARNVKPEPTPAWIKISRLSGDVPPDAPLSGPPDVGSQDQRTAFARAAELLRDGDYDGAIGVLSDLSQTSAAQPEV